MSQPAEAASQEEEVEMELFTPAAAKKARLIAEEAWALQQVLELSIPVRKAGLFGQGRRHGAAMPMPMGMFSAPLACGSNTQVSALPLDVCSTEAPSLVASDLRMSDGASVT